MSITLRLKVMAEEIEDCQRLAIPPTTSELRRWKATAQDAHDALEDRATGGLADILRAALKKLADWTPPLIETEESEIKWIACDFCKGRGKLDNEVQCPACAGLRRVPN